MSIHERIRTLREAKGWSHQRLANEISTKEGLTKPLAWQTVQQWEKGVSAPKRTRLTHVAAALGVPVESLMSGSVGWVNPQTGEVKSVPEFLAAQVADKPDAVEDDPLASDHSLVFGLLPEADQKDVHALALALLLQKNPRLAALMEKAGVSRRADDTLVMKHLGDLQRPGAARTGHLGGRSTFGELSDAPEEQPRKGAAK